MKKFSEVVKKKSAILRLMEVQVKKFNEMSDKDRSSQAGAEVWLEIAKFQGAVDVLNWVLND